MKKYQEFCNSHKLQAFPLHQQNVILFVSNLAVASSHSNIKVHLAAIKYHSCIKGYGSDFAPFRRLYLLLRGIKRAQGKVFTRTKRMPIMPRLLCIINLNLFNSSILFEDKIMLWAAILVAFFGFLRVSEYTAPCKGSYDPNTTLLYQDAVINNSRCTITLKSSKTDPFRQGTEIRLAANKSILCPISALKNCMHTHPNKYGHYLCLITKNI